MSSNLVICVRNISSGNSSKFTAEPGPTRYLEVPDGQAPSPNHELSRCDWVKKLRKRAIREPDSGDIEDTSAGDILVFVHGYNNSIGDIMDRHDLLQRNLRCQQFAGAIVSFDWPSAASAVNYLEDRSDARATADRLVEDGIKLLAVAQRDEENDNCAIDVHLLGHSTGAYVIREAFYYASQSRRIARINWNVSQVVFIGGDIARRSLSVKDQKSQALFYHSTRITNYQNPFDRALKLSNVKRVGLAPRIGRIGIPDDAPMDSVVNVNTGTYWQGLERPNGFSDISWSHSWHFGDEVFAKDLAATLAGDVDRRVIATREVGDQGLILMRPDA